MEEADLNPPSPAVARTPDAPAATRVDRRELAFLGSRVRELRLRANLTQQELADAVGVARTTIMRFESGSHDLGSSRIRSIAQALQVPPGAIFDSE